MGVEVSMSMVASSFWCLWGNAMEREQKLGAIWLLLSLSLSLYVLCVCVCEVGVSEIEGWVRVLKREDRDLQRQI